MSVSPGFLRNLEIHVRKYAFVNRTIKNWSKLPAGLLAYFPCKINTFGKRVKNVVTGRGIEVGV